jgi:hypothetical protein
MLSSLIEDCFASTPKRNTETLDTLNDIGYVWMGQE